MSPDDLAALARRLADVEEDNHMLRARIEQLEERLQGTIAGIEAIRIALNHFSAALGEQALQVVTTTEHVAEQVTERVIQAVLSKDVAEIRKIQDMQADLVSRLQQVTEKTEAESRAVTALFEERANELSTAALLDIYEQRIKPTGQGLKSWLKTIRAEQRYRAVVALRSRRQSS